jgi:hypothetical protein
MTNNSFKLDEAIGKFEEASKRMAQAASELLALVNNCKRKVYERFEKAGINGNDVAQFINPALERANIRFRVKASDYWETEGKLRIEYNGKRIPGSVEWLSREGKIGLAELIQVAKELPRFIEAVSEALAEMENKIKRK